MTPPTPTGDRMMTNECRMTPEQFEALLKVMFKSYSAQMRGTVESAENADEAIAEARRLLVEPEQGEIHDGHCTGGPLDGMGLESDDDVVKRPGGLYEWGSDLKEWYWIPDEPTDPDLTTFGSIPRGHRCQALDEDPVIAGKVFRRAYDGLLRHGRNAVEEETGKLWQIGDDEPVRRLAQ